MEGSGGVDGLRLTSSNGTVVSAAAGAVCGQWYRDGW